MQWIEVSFFRNIPNQLTLIKIFLIDASFIFSIARRIFSAFSIAAEVGFNVSYSLFDANDGVGSTCLFSFRRMPKNK